MVTSLCASLDKDFAEALLRAYLIPFLTHPQVKESLAQSRKRIKTLKVQSKIAVQDIFRLIWASSAANSKVEGWLGIAGFI